MAMAASLSGEHTFYTRYFCYWIHVMTARFFASYSSFIDHSAPVTGISTSSAGQFARHSARVGFIDLRDVPASAFIDPVNHAADRSWFVHGSIADIERGTPIGPSPFFGASDYGGSSGQHFIVEGGWT
jgi:hypothetical protein